MWSKSKKVSQLMTKLLAKDRSPSRALDEYKETLAFLRHDDQMMWTILGLSGTVALALWGVALKDVWSSKAVATAGLGVLALSLGRLMARRITAYTQSRKQRADELEQILGFELMSMVHKRMSKTKIPGINKILDLVMSVSIIGWLVYVGAYCLHRK
jgi:hypothetical protein